MDDSYANGLVAKAGGGQSGATPIGVLSGSGAATMNRFTTVANANDSALLPPAAPGLRYYVKNAAASNSMNIFPAVGTDQINTLGANAAFALGAGKTVHFLCMVAGQWDTHPLVP
jgi:hypothetical protein